MAHMLNPEDSWQLHWASKVAEHRRGQRILAERTLSPKLQVASSKGNMGVDRVWV